MDPRERAKLVSMLHKEMLRSTDRMFRASQQWSTRSEQLKAAYGDDTAETFMRKNNDLRLKEYMGVYVWHRDNAQTCASILTALAMWAPDPNDPVNQMMERAARFAEELEAEHASSQSR